ncbi:MAG: hypothetical protein QHH10_05895 [Peptococcaceae bacterium]|nr:hypothetical protein [Peptococcaceae bacterium]MDH7524834.1 hypothetical protein [Peptococcaceae bacterium]
MGGQLGILVAVLGYDTVNEDEFNDWYETEHIPERMKIPGFLSAERYLAINKEKTSVAIYDLSSVDVLRGPEYKAIAGNNYSPWTKRIQSRVSGFLRYEAVQVNPGTQVAPGGAGGLLLVGYNVGPEAEDEVNRWYETEHIPALLQVEGVLSARRYRCVDGPHKYLAVYHLTAPEVCKSEMWRKAAETPWTHAVRPKMGERLWLECRLFRRYERQER